VGSLEYLLSLLFEPEDGSDMFLRIANRIALDYEALYARGYTRHTQMSVAVSKVNKMYFSVYTGTTYTVSGGNCPNFSGATSSSPLKLTVGPRDPFPRWRQ
jgi:hypothetical protein